MWIVCQYQQRGKETWRNKDGESELSVAVAAVTRVSPLLSGRRLIVNGRPSGHGHAHSGPTPRPGFAETSLNKYRAIPRPLTIPPSLPKQEKHSLSFGMRAWVVPVLYFTPRLCHGDKFIYTELHTRVTYFLTRLFDVYDLKIGSRSEVNFSNVPQCIISGKASQISLAINLGSARYGNHLPRSAFSLGN